MKDTRKKHTPEERWNNCYSAAFRLTDELIRVAGIETADAVTEIIVKHLFKVKDIIDGNAPEDEVNTALDELESHILRCHKANKLL